MKQILKDILQFGSRPVGSEAHDRVTSYIFEKMKRVIPETWKDTFSFEGWESCGAAELYVTQPVRQKLDTFLFLGSGGGEVKGMLKWLGKNYVWNMYGWDLYAVYTEEHKICAYISGRDQGAVLSQTLIEGNTELPHFIIGAAENDQLKKLLSDRETVMVSGTARCRKVEKMQGNNIVVPVSSAKPEEDVVILCAHYDSMYNTKGAYDNGAGTAVLMALAEEWAKEPPDQNLLLVFMDAEECRLEGAKHFAHMMPSSKVRYVLNIDGIGREDELEIWCGPEKFSRKIEQELFLYPGTYKKMLKWPPPPGSDHAPFYENGTAVCMLTFNDQDIIHTERDVYQELLMKNMERMRALILYLLHRIS